VTSARSPEDAQSMLDGGKKCSRRRLRSLVVNANNAPRGRVSRNHVHFSVEYRPLSVERADHHFQSTDIREPFQLRRTDGKGKQRFSRLNLSHDRQYLLPQRSKFPVRGQVGFGRRIDDGSHGIAQFLKRVSDQGAISAGFSRSPDVLNENGAEYCQSRSRCGAQKRAVELQSLACRHAILDEERRRRTAPDDRQIAGQADDREQNDRQQNAADQVVSRALHVAIASGREVATAAKLRGLFRAYWFDTVSHDRVVQTIALRLTRDKCHKLGDSTREHPTRAHPGSPADGYHGFPGQKVSALSPDVEIGFSHVRPHRCIAEMGRRLARVKVQP